MRFAFRSALALVAAVLPLLVAAPANTLSFGPIRYDALGDSYASGAGALPYDGPTCGRSVAAPARLLNGRVKVRLDDFVACGGARVRDIAGQTAALDARTDLVTVSIGGNDVFWNDAVTACITRDETACRAAIERSRVVVDDELPAMLDSAYTQIREAAPNARVLVTGYARLFSPEFGDAVYAFGTVTVAEQRMMNEGADILNSVIRAAAERHRFAFVDVTQRFLGHGVNAKKPWILGIDGAAPFHPNRPGYRAYASAITARVKR